MNKLIAAVSITSVLALVGCAKEPPECSAPEVADTVRGILSDAVSPEAISKAGGSAGLRDDPTAVLDAFRQNIKLTLSNVVSDGYDSQAKKRMCSADMNLEIPGGKSLQERQKFSVQRTEGKDAGAMVLVENVTNFERLTLQGLDVYFVAKRIEGEWPGTYACQGIDGTNDGPQGPFSMPVTMVVKGEDASVERTTKGGGVEKMTGQIDIANEKLDLFGKGQNTIDDAWTVHFNGAYSGMEYKAQGQIADGTGAAMRQCQLTLSLPKNLLP